ncbi:non-ribosomal peptide synthetase [Hydrogenophaga soli]
MNPVVVKSVLDDGDTADLRFDKISKTLREARTYEAIPFERVVKDLGNVFDRSQHPVFQVMINYVPYAERQLRSTNLKFQQIEISRNLSPLDITLYIEKSIDGGINLTLQYDIALFKSETIDELARQTEAMLAAVLEDPKVLVQRVDLRKSVPDGAIVRSEKHSSDPLVLEKFYRHLHEGRADAYAVQDAEGKWTYGQLASAVSIISETLCSGGFQRGDAVALLATRCSALPAAILGIWQAGGTVFIVDPASPKAHVERLLSAARVSGIISVGGGTREVALELAVPDRLLLLDIPSIGFLIPAQVDPSPPLPVQQRPAPEQVAYLVSTSGTTGEPKIVATSHRALSHFLEWQARVFEISRSDRVSVLSGIGHDPIYRDLFAPLWSGATCCLPLEETRRDVGLGEWVAKSQITVMHVTPALARLAVLEARELCALRLIFLAGESVLASDVAAIRRIAPNADVIGFYGATETPQAMAWHRFDAAEQRDNLVGKPISDVQLLVLNPVGVPCAIGELGEIHVATEYLSLGYVGDARNTALKFIPAPCALGGRIYRTGDGGRLGIDGSVIFCGRKDTEVKLRGFRVNCSEIEDLILELGLGATAVAVLPFLNARGENVLAAYMVCPGQEPDIVRRYGDALAAILPSYKVPNVIWSVDRIPLTRNAKVDRAELARRAMEISQSTLSKISPRTETEARLSRIWGDVLGMEAVGIEDNFFELGGHSLLATQVISKVRQSFERDVPLKALFEAPTVEKLARLIDSMVPVEGHWSIARRDISQALRPSFAQERMHFLHKLDPGSAVYNVPAVFRLRGRLDLQALSSSVRDLQLRHETLRTTFEDKPDGGCYVTVHDAPLAVLEMEDYSGLADPVGNALASAEREAHEAFDLRQGPLLRARLFKVGQEDHVLMVAMHHIVTDGWSMSILVAEIQEFYAARCAARAPGLAPLSIQYGDYAAWQRQALTGKRLDHLSAYWTQHLASPPAATELPFDRPRPAMQTFRGGVVLDSFDASLSRQLDLLGQKFEATTFMVLLSAFYVLLGRYANQEDLIIGTPIANRNHAQIEPLAGLFVNTLALRVDASGDPRIVDLLERVKAITLAGYAHQDMPFEKVVESLHLPRDLSRSPLFQVLFAFQNTPPSQLALTGLEVEAVDPVSSTAKFDLSLYASPAGAKGYSLRWEYNADLFESATVERMRQHFRRVVDAMTANPWVRLSEIDILTEQEKQQISAWNNTAQIYDQSPVHRKFSLVAKKYPKSRAVSLGDEYLSFEALDKQSGRLANYLARAGVCPSDTVGLCLERSIQLPIAILAVLKAGAVCVPLDTSYPMDRLRFMVSDANIKVLITQRSLSHLDISSSIQIIFADEEFQQSTEPEESLNYPSRPEDLSYIIFTSGSTGRPKGVGQTHKMLANLVAWQLAESKLPAESRTLQFSPMSFDVFFDELFSTWLAAGELVLVDEGTRKDSFDLLSLIQAREVERIFVPYVALQGIAEAALLLKSMGSLRLKEVVCGGEQLQVSGQIRSMFAKLDGALLHNQYGPTESHFITGHRLEGNPFDWEDIPPIGRSINNSIVHVLDQYLNRVPINVFGELYLSGDNIARDYFGRPSLTAERFLPDPFGRPGERMYRTGDVGKIRSNGDIEYLGRADSQVKIRGYRVELAEVEQAFMSTGHLVACAVVVQKSASGIKSLCAFVVFKTGEDGRLKSIKDHVGSILPDHMVPSRIQAINALPLTPSGKIDRLSLVQNISVIANDRIAPRTETEARLSRIWGDVLGMEAVGIEDNFFELGGHSLLATQVISKVRQSFERDVPLKALFEAPTVEKLARLIDSMVPVEGHWSIARRDISQALRPSFAQERMHFLHKLDPGSAVYNVPAVFRLRGRLDLQALSSSVRDLQLRHETLRTTFEDKPDGGCYVTVHDAPLAVLEMEDYSGLADPVGNALASAEREAHEAFDLRQGPLLRARLFKVGQEDHVLMVAMHHIVTDGWSMSILVAEIQEFYAARCAARAPGLAPLSIQYGDYAAWQRQALTGKRLDHLSAYWTQHLASPPAATELPFDRPRPAMQTFRGGVVLDSFDASLSRQLDLLGQKFEATTFMVLLSAFYVLLGRYANQEDLIIGTPIANRNHAQIEPLAGLFVNTLALRVDASGDPRIVDLLERVKAITLAGYAHQDMPFEKVVESLHLPRDLSRSPLFQVLFAFQNTPPSQLALTGLEVEAVDPVSSTAKFDLSLYASPAGAKGYSLRWEYNADLFESATVERMRQHFRRVVDAMTANPWVRLSEIDILTEQEKQQISAWNNTARHEEFRSIVQMVEERAQSQPESVAIIHRNRRVSYRDLVHQATLVANGLLARPCFVGRPIAIILDRTVELLAALLGVQKSGNFYLPIDPSLPDQRISYILEDSGAALIIGSSEQIDRIARISRLEMCGVDDLIRMPFVERSGAYVSIAEGDPAYAIYTSGSTGSPKGTVISHKALVNFLLAMRSAPGIGAEDTVMAITSISFDISALEIYLPLIVGAAVVLVGSEDAKDGAFLANRIEEHSVTLVQATPSTYSLMLKNEWAGRRGLRLLCGGEALPKELARQLLERCDELWNMYGPTETTIWSLIKRIVDPDRIGLGRPIRNTTIHVVGKSGAPCPTGVVGELLIGGEGLADGYLGRPALTAEKFIPSSDGKPGERLYRTGDVVKRTSDGELVFMGRADSQVKIRGMRIELGEIEAVLETHPMIEQAVVVVSLQCDQQVIAAYVTTKRDSFEDTASILAHAREFLPTYMVPITVRLLDKLPLTANGKIDRKSLTLYEISSGSKGAKPISDLEVEVAGIWAEVLGRKEIFLEENFFEIGGNSLSAVAVASAVSSRLQKEVHVRHIFEARNLADFVVRLAQAPLRASGISCLKQGSGAHSLYLFHALGGGVADYSAAINTLRSDISVYCLTVDALGELPSSVSEMARQYAVKILTHHQSGSCALAGWSFGAILAFETAKQMEAHSFVIERLILLDPPSPGFDLGKNMVDNIWPLGLFLADAMDDANLARPDVEVLEDIQARPDRDEVAIAFARSLGLLPATLSKHFILQRSAIYEKNRELMTNYMPTGIARVSASIAYAASAKDTQSWSELLPSLDVIEVIAPTHRKVLLQAGPFISRALDASRLVELDTIFESE